MISPQTQIGLQVFYFCFTGILIGLRYWAHRLNAKNHAVKSTALRIRDAAILIVWAISIFGEALLIKNAVLRIQNDKSPNPDKLVPAFGVPEGKITGSLKMNLVVKVIYHTILWLCKAAFLAFYFNLITYLTPCIRVALYSVTAYTIATYILSVGLSIFWCQPISRNWAYGPDNCTAFMEPVPLTIQQIANISTDIMIMILPIQIFRRHHLNTREKNGVAFIFFLGLLTIAAGTTRYALIMKFITSPENGLFKGLPIEVYELAAQLELLVAFFATCLPSLRVLLNIARQNSNCHTESVSKISTHGGGSKLGRSSNSTIRPPEPAQSYGDGSQVELMTPKGWPGRVELGPEDEVSQEDWRPSPTSFRSISHLPVPQVHAR